MSITAIVLAGGRGSRMNYQDKAWVDYQGKPLLMHVIDSISSTVDDVVISSSRNHPSYDELPWRKISDNSEDFLGPLSGIASARKAVDSNLTLVVPCDVPNLPDDLVAILTRELNGHEICVAHDGARLQQLVFVARTEILDTIPDYLAEGKRSVKGWLETVNYSVGMLPESYGKLRNINDLDQL